MSSKLPLVKRSQLSKVLVYEAHQARIISISAVIGLSIVTMLSSLGYLNHLWSNTSWLRTITTPEVLFGLDAMAALAWINARFQPTIWLSSIFYLPVAASLWIVARSIIIIAYLAQNQFQNLLHVNTSVELTIYQSVAEQNFTIVALCLLLSLWAGFIHVKSSDQPRTLTLTTAALLVILTILNGVRLLVPIQDFGVIWCLTVVFSLVSLALMTKLKPKIEIQNV